MALTNSHEPVTGAIRLVAGKSGISLYMANTTAATRTKPPFYSYETVLSPTGGADGTWPAITIAQPLPPPPAWDLCAAGDGTLNAAYQVFGGGSNILQVGSVADGEAGNQYGYGLYNCGMPRFLRDNSGSAPAKGLVSFILDYQQLGLLVPQSPDQNGNIAAEFVALTPASAGIVFGDLGSGSLPGNLTLIYKTDRCTGPLSPGGLFLGKLSLANYDLAKKTLATPQPLLTDMDIAEFDVAVQQGVYCLLMSMGNGSPLLAAFDNDGKMLGTPYPLYGVWSNTNGWIANPCIVADPQPDRTGDTLTFRIAFIVFDGDSPKDVYSDAVSVSPKNGVMPSVPPAAAGG